VATGGSEDEIRIRKVLTDQSAAWNRGDAVGWADAFTANADFVNLRGTVITGSSGIAKAIGGAAVFKGTHLTITVRKLTFLSSDVAMIDTNYLITGIAVPIPGFTSNGVLKTLVKYIAVRHDGKWRFTAAQNTAAT